MKAPQAYVCFCSLLTPALAEVHRPSAAGLITRGRSDRVGGAGVAGRRAYQRRWHE